MNYFTSNISNNKEMGYKDSINSIIKILIKKVKEDSDNLSHDIWLMYRDDYLSLPKEHPKRKEILDKVNSIEEEIKKGCPNVIKNYFSFLKVKTITLYQSFIENLDKIYQSDLFILCQEFLRRY